MYPRSVADSSLSLAPGHKPLENVLETSQPLVIGLSAALYSNTSYTQSISREGERPVTSLNLNIKLFHQHLQQAKHQL